MDFLGPYFVRKDKSRVKVYLLIITCMFTRAVDLKIVTDLTTEQFMRAFQLHGFQYGIPEICITDLNKQIKNTLNTPYIKKTENIY